MAVHVVDPVLRWALIRDLERRAHAFKLAAVESDSLEEDDAFRRQAAVLEQFAADLDYEARTRVH